MPQYAAETTVSADASRAEIEKTLRRYGADGFVYGWQGVDAMVGFTMEGRQVRFILQMPDRNDEQFTHYRHSRGSLVERKREAAEKAWEQATRQRWRALALVIKAKLEAVESGITEFEDEFLAHIVLPDGSTMGKWARPQIAKAYDKGIMPPMLALGSGE